MAERLVPSTKKAMEHREEKPKVPSSDPEPDLVTLVAEQQPQLQREHQPPNISEMKPLTREAYGGGMYGTDENARRDPARPRASATQSADGPEEQRAATWPTHPPPPSTGDRDLDITGQSYIQ
ncbi:hypothetical protein BDA96_01G550800 [Sorghum bicolor]|jgi:hypothetical protein|uniref:Uncharacterized protein n=2 Tax=Sorghum bicolor TaxID=4558 RepID=A0A921S745_SORBI|nr:uncharacterized protein LOC8057415 [Sorghum bicolor]EER95562.1 hypothetical protein SORBI_3001G515700 [Sorghum bicolor]KAG0552931.1 hypothetical protein BDA96_01G550800 [Sorghum bicolor]|eukprot:XP_002468564.1 uncharacterized protein LOC8057415 [Sorghum bicolor]